MPGAGVRAKILFAREVLKTQGEVLAKTGNELKEEARAEEPWTQSGEPCLSHPYLPLYRPAHAVAKIRASANHETKSIRQMTYALKRIASLDLRSYAIK